MGCPYISPHEKAEFLFLPRDGEDFSRVEDSSRRPEIIDRRVGKAEGGNRTIQDACMVDGAVPVAFASPFNRDQHAAERCLNSTETLEVFRAIAVVRGVIGHDRPAFTDDVFTEGASR